MWGVPLTQDAHAHLHALALWHETKSALPIAVDERALSATDVSYEGRHLADTELLTPPQHTTKAWNTCTGRTTPPLHRRLMWSLTPDAYHSMRALALTSTAALRLP
jgi:hypothetical protein